jgi:hypothetical protein
MHLQTPFAREITSYKNKKTAENITFQRFAP